MPLCAVPVGTRPLCHEPTRHFRAGLLIVASLRDLTRIVALFVGMNQRRSASSNPAVRFSSHAHAIQVSGRINTEDPVLTATRRILCVDAATSLEALPSVEASTIFDTLLGLRDQAAQTRKARE
jgi:hypothetical protein